MEQNQPDPDELIDSKEAAAILKVSPALLARWRVEKRENPKPIKLGHRTVRYRRGDIDALIEQRRQDG